MQVPLPSRRRAAATPAGPEPTITKLNQSMPPLLYAPAQQPENGGERGITNSGQCHPVTGGAPPNLLRNQTDYQADGHEHHGKELKASGKDNQTYMVNEALAHPFLNDRHTRY